MCVDINSGMDFFSFPFITDITIAQLSSFDLYNSRGKKRQLHTAKGSEIQPPHPLPAGPHALTFPPLPSQPMRFACSQSQSGHQPCTAFSVGRGWTHLSGMRKGRVIVGGCVGAWITSFFFPAVSVDYFGQEYGIHFLHSPALGKKCL